MLRIYRAPSGHCYQFEEGKAPDGFVLVESKPAEPKARAPRNKARTTKTK